MTEPKWKVVGLDNCSVVTRHSDYMCKYVKDKITNSPKETLGIMVFDTLLQAVSWLE